MRTLSILLLVATLALPATVFAYHGGGHRGGYHRQIAYEVPQKCPYAWRDGHSSRWHDGRGRGWHDARGWHQGPCWYGDATPPAPDTKDPEYRGN